ncbi:MAG: MATE family efflux transporter [Bilifractor sp.]
MDNSYQKEERIRLLTFTLPILAELLVTCIISMGSQYYLNAYSKDAMAIVGSLSQIVNFVINLYTIISVGGSILLAPAVGRGDMLRQKELVVVMLVGNTIFALAVSTGMLVLIRPIMNLMHIDPRLTGFGDEYLAVSCGLSLLQSLLITYTAIFRSLGQMKAVMAADFSVFFVCFLLNLMIYYLIPSDYQHLWQYTLSGIIGQATGVFFLSLRLRSIFKETVHGKNSECMVISFLTWKRILREILKYGIPGGSEGLVYLVGIAICTSITGMLGTRILLIRSYVGILAGYLEICMTAVCTAVFPLIGHNYGRGSNERIRYDFRLGIEVSYLFTVLVGLLFFLFGDQVLRIFTDDREVIRDVCKIFRYQFLVDMFKIPAAFGVAGLKAVGKTREPFVMVVISSITEVIVAYLLGVVSGMGLEGIFIAYAVDNALRAAVLCMSWKRYTSHGKRASVRMS